MQALAQALPLSISNYRLTVSYDGTNFEGWQIQLEHQRTIQGELNKALKKISKSDNVTSLGSGRTDSGVHAVAQVVKVSIPLEIGPESLQRALNSHLPDEIRVVNADLSNADFHPVRDAKWKTYQYLFYEGDVLPPQTRNLMTNVGGRELDWDKVQSALKLFQGEHDFINYSTKGTEVKSTIRRIFSTELEIKPFNPIYENNAQGRLISIRVTGNGFLKQMVRLIVGTVVAAGRSKVSEQQIIDSFKEESAKKLAAVAPPQGLYLMHVEYDKHYQSEN